jgi:tetratricopeptide (TPR) repeat protein
MPRHIPSGPTVAITLADLDPDLARELSSARTPSGWDQAAVTQIVRKYYGFLGGSISAAVMPRHPTLGDGVETLAVVLNEGDAIRESPAESIFAEGIRAAERGEMKAALQSFTRAVSLNRVEPRYYRALAQANLELGQLDDAERTFQQCLRLDPNDADALTMLGNVHYSRRAFDAAIQCYRRSISIEPTPYALTNLGAALGELGDARAATDAFNQALALDPTYHQARRGLEIARRGRRA